MRRRTGSTAGPGAREVGGATGSEAVARWGGGQGRRGGRARRRMVSISPANRTATRALAMFFFNIITWRILLVILACKTNNLCRECVGLNKPRLTKVVRRNILFLLMKNLLASITKKIHMFKIDQA